MKIEKINIDRLIPYARNPRNNKASVSKVASSIKEYGWQQPIVVDNEMVVIAGHTRLLAAQQLGLNEVPVHIAANLTAEQIKAYRLADNRIAQDSEWDESLLALELAELESLDFDLDLTGFTPNELNDLLAKEMIEGLVDEDLAPPVPDNPISKLEDVWLLGDHRLVCGDATNSEHVKLLMDGNLADLVFTDPPYNVDYGGGRKAGSTPPGARVKAHGTILNDKMTPEEFETFCENFFKSYLGIMKPLSCIYVCHSDQKSEAKMTFQRTFDDHFYFSSTLIWAKNNAGLGFQDYRAKHEPMLYGWKEGKGKHQFFGERTKTTVWNIKREPTTEYVHPTQKPVELVSEAMFNSSKGKDNVVDFFGGSGSVVIAGEKIDRKTFVMELDPKYCDVIIQRWQNYTGKEAVNEKLKKTYNAIRG
jgi:DNA modification methylase